MEEKKSNFRVSKPQNLHEAIEAMMKHFNLEKKYREKQVLAYWHEMMGESVSKRTKELYLHDQKLFVRISSAPLKQEIVLMRSKIIAKLMLKFGEVLVKDIVLL
jgi:predicted nucleic acid-binding Zn ribbon protein